ncbi:MAG: family 43 glycosylhydrolase [Bacteroidaceae bacterium]|nr:family 43 glycosylhydrolase [Bacteroidaceae bacterium]
MKRILLLFLILSSLGANAQRKTTREYVPSPVKGTAWNTPGNINPFIPGYFADPTIRQFGDTYYVYSTTDGTGNGYGPAQVWMSKDFVNWRNFVMNWPTTEVVWAPDVVQQPNGKYRYYYCEPCNVNIGESDSPIGPWKNILGKEDAVMVPDRFIHNVITLDPMLFKDDDGSQYLYFTTWGIYKGFGCGVAKLKDGDFDIKDLATKYQDARRWNENNPYPIAADKFFTEKKLILNDELKDIFEAPFVFKKDGIYYFTYSSGSCHTDTYRVQYATSKISPMGPWEYKGELLTTNEDGTIHGPGHHSILEKDGNYYIIYHRHNIAKSVHGFNRQLCIDKLEFDNEGNIIKITPTHNGINPLPAKLQKRALQHVNLAYGASVTASSYYDGMHKPEYAVDDNNATLWKARHTNWDSPQGKHNTEWIQIDLGKPQVFNEIWTQFEYPTFFYQYKIETSTDGIDWRLYSDKTSNTKQGSPMIDSGSTKARYIRLSVTDTQKNGHLPAIWNVKVWKNAPELPSVTEDTNDASYPGMHKKDVQENQRNNFAFAFDMKAIARDARKPFDIESVPCQMPDAANTANITFSANKPIHARVKNGRWALFFNGTQNLTSSVTLPDNYRYNSPYTISAWILPTKLGPVSTVASLSSSRNDLATTEFRIGTDPSTGLVNHNGSFESYGCPKEIKENEGKWQFWTITYDGWKEKAYLNGQLVHEQNNFIMIRPEGKIKIGSDAFDTNFFMGYISSISISPVSLDDNAIREIYVNTNKNTEPSLGDDDFEEIDPDSKFEISETMKVSFEKKDVFTLSTSSSDFNNAPLTNGGVIYEEVSGDFAVIAKIEDMEGLSQHSVKGYNEGGILIADSTTYYQIGAFPLYNCGNMLTILSRHGRPQYPNYKGYNFDPYIQFERKGDLLYARTSQDLKTWSNMPGSPIKIKSSKLQIGAYQTTYSENTSWVKISNYTIYK